MRPRQRRLVQIKTAIDLGIGVINKVITFINNIKFKIPGVDVKSIGLHIGGQTISLGPDIPTIKPLARGGSALGGGSHLVGEEGPELFVPERDGYVMTHADTVRLLASLESGPPRGPMGGVAHTAEVNISVPDPAWAEIIAQRVVRTQAAAFSRVRT